MLKLKPKSSLEIIIYLVRFEVGSEAQHLTRTSTCRSHQEPYGSNDYFENMAGKVREILQIIDR